MCYYGKIVKNITRRCSIINWQHLMYFLSLAKWLNYRKASEELFVDVSTISKAITGLEEALGVTLFQKDGRTLQLTKYGKIFLDHVNNANTDIQEGIQIIESLCNTFGGTINIASMYTLVSYYLPEVLNILKANYSDLDINLFQNPTRQIIRDVLNQEVDLGLCGEFDFEAYADKLNWEWLLNEEIVLVVPETHPLASQATVSVNDILDEVFIGYNDLTGIHLNIDAALANKFEKDIQLNYMLKVNEESSAIGLVRSGLGITFLPLTPYLNLTGVKVIDLADFYVVRNIYLIWNKLVPLTKGARLIRDTILSNNQKIKAMNEFQ